ncbi:hypothetical protein FJTKL_03019 [Diaporthe vaccinii]|uniref:Uncharacterized protein n=1 Tax=Diaporthe vaccinii TaxID=105482 RepID=A0ABR4DX44_9PEZI
MLYFAKTNRRVRAPRCVHAREKENAPSKNPLTKTMSISTRSSHSENMTRNPCYGCDDGCGCILQPLSVGNLLSYLSGRCLNRKSGNAVQCAC